MESEKKELYLIEKSQLLQVLNNLGQGPYNTVAFSIQVLSQLQPLTNEVKEKLEGMEKDLKEK